MDLASIASSTDEPLLDNAFELDDQGQIARPEMLLTDWVELFLLAALLIFGLPLNAVALSKQLNCVGAVSGGSSSSTFPLFHPRRKNSRITRQDVTRTNFLWLKLHLTIVDLLVIACYCPSHIAWLIGYTWSAGETLCKAMQYSWDFCFHLMSFGVASIALDRLRTVYGLMRMERTGKLSPPSQQLLFVKRLITWSYVGAALVSLPQWMVWTTIDLKGWSQCTTIWHKMRVLEFLAGKESTESFAGERLYTLVHLLTVFWLPFLAILAAYMYIVLFLFFYSLRPAPSFSPPAGILHSPSSAPLIPQQPLVLPPPPPQPEQPEGMNRMNDRIMSGTNGTLEPLMAPLNTSEHLAPVWPIQSEPTTPCSPSRPTTTTNTTTTSSSSCQTSNSTATSATCAAVGRPLLQRNGTFSSSKKRSSQPQLNTGVPAWRLEMRSKIFRTTIHVIAAYLICWLPYNVLALATFFSKQLQITISVQLELLRICVLLNALLNPFIYGFKRGNQP